METATKNTFQNLFSPSLTKRFNPYSQQVFSQLYSCHTIKQGYHLSICNNGNCAEIQHRYHSCGNRHCPNCGSVRRDEWIENRTNELLPTPYYHVVFTLPHELNSLIMGNRRILFDVLFASASETLLNHGKNKDFLGAELGITMVLHTWGQDLSFHPHVHCIVTGGGFDGEKWIEAKRKNNKFLFPQKSLAKMYKAIFLKKLSENKMVKWEQINPSILIKNIGFKKWNVYAKAPFGGPAQVVEYLGRYTHKIAITRHRILDVTENQVRFKYKDYADKSKTKEMSLSKYEFLRRFEQHILPKRYVKIRHSGFLRSKNKGERIAKIRESLKLSEPKPKVKIPIAVRMLEKHGCDILQCPICKIGKLITLINTRDLRNRKVTKTIFPAPS